MSFIPGCAIGLLVGTAQIAAGLGLTHLLYKSSGTTFQAEDTPKYGLLSVIAVLITLVLNFYMTCYLGVSVLGHENIPIPHLSQINFSEMTSGIVNRFS